MKEHTSEIVILLGLQIVALDQEADKYSLRASVHVFHTY